MKGKIIFWGLAVLVAVAAAYFLLHTEEPGSGGGFGGQGIAVRAQTVDIIAFSDRIEALGTTLANDSVQLTTRVSETIETVAFEDGQYVEEGDVLVTMSRGEELAQLAEAEANVREAEAQYERTRDLVANGNASTATLDQRLRDLEGARSRLVAAQARVDDRVVRAPFSGVLGLRQVSPGTLVNPGTVITTLDDISTVRLDFTVPERFLSVLEQGQEIEARAAAYEDEVFTGVVATVSTRVDPVTRAVTVRANIPNEDRRLKPGMLMTVRLYNRPRQRPAVPAESIVPVGDQAFVFIVNEDNVANRIEVETGLRQNGMVEIISGLRGGERVVYSGTMMLRSGIPVRDLNQQQGDAS